MRSLKKTLEDAGTIKDFAGATVPAGWLVCDGSAISRTTYARLFNAIGTAYGVGDGSTTFNIPDYVGRVAVGVDAGASRVSGLTGRGSSNGAQSKAVGVGTLAVSDTIAIGSTAIDTSQMPSHQHDADTYSTNLAYNGRLSSYSQLTPVTVSNAVKATGGGGTHTHTKSGSASLTGAPGNADVLQPSLAVYKIIRI